MNLNTHIKDSVTTVKATAAGLPPGGFQSTGWIEKRGFKALFRIHHIQSDPVQVSILHLKKSGKRCCLLFVVWKFPSDYFVSDIHISRYIYIYISVCVCAYFLGGEE